jgi:hypothetical protein
MQPVKLLSNAQLQWTLSISSKRRTRIPNKGKSVHEIQPIMSPAKSVCRFRAGHEEHTGVGYTPGFECDPNSSITLEGHGVTMHIEFRNLRNTRRMVYTSLFLNQVWRGNVDTKPLMYQSDPANTDPEDIVTCSD